MVPARLAEPGLARVSRSCGRGSAAARPAPRCQHQDAVEPARPTTGCSSGQAAWRGADRVAEQLAHRGDHRADRVPRGDPLQPVGHRLDRHERVATGTSAGTPPRSATPCTASGERTSCRSTCRPRSSPRRTASEQERAPAATCQHVGVDPPADDEPGGRAGSTIDSSDARRARRRSGRAGRPTATPAATGTGRSRLRCRSVAIAVAGPISPNASDLHEDAADEVLAVVAAVDGDGAAEHVTRTAART